MDPILIPVDGSESSERALGKGIELANALKAKLMFLYVANVNQLAVNSCLSAELLEAVNKAGDVVLTHAEESAPEGIETERVMETGSPAPVIIDEIQYAPELLPLIKIRVDNDKRNGQYFLTGSQMFHLMKNVSESLAGRAAVTPLYGLSRNEIIGKNEIPFLPTNNFSIEDKCKL